jgi:hypothetical protein
MHKTVVYTNSEVSFKYKGNETDIEKEWEKLQNILKSAIYKSVGKIKRRNSRKYLKNME